MSCNNVDIAAAAPVSAVGAAFGNILFSSEAYGPGSTPSRFDEDSSRIDKHQDCLGKDIDIDAEATPVSVSDFSVGQSEKGVVTAYADVVSRFVRSSPLPDKDGPRSDLFSTKPFDAQSLGVAVSSVPGASLSFFMCHWSFSSLIFPKRILR